MSQKKPNAKKMSGLFRWSWLLFSIVLPVGELSGQDSLAHYLTLAARANPLVMQRFYEYQAALQRISQAAVPGDPTLEAGFFLSPMELTEGRQLAEFRLMQMFPRFGTLRAAKDEMSAMANARYEAFRGARNDAMFSLHKAYFSLFLTTQAIKNATESLQLLRSLYSLATTRFSVSTETTSQSQAQGMPGAMSQSPLRQNTEEGLLGLYALQLEINQAESELVMLQNKRVTQTAEMNRTMNRPPLMPVHMTETLNMPVEPVNPQAIEDSMLIHNPMLGMTMAEAEAIESRMVMVKRMGYPMVGIGLNYMVIAKQPGLSAEMNGRNMVMPMFAFTLPLYRSKYRSMQNETKQQMRALRQKSEESVNDIQTEYYIALQELEDSRVKARLYEKQKALAAQSLAILMSSFSSGTRDLKEILQMRRQLLDYAIMHTEAEVDHQIAQAKMKWLAGQEPIHTDLQ